MADPDDPSKADYVTLANFRYTLRSFLRFAEQQAELAGLTPQQYQALLSIKGVPERDHVSIGELAEMLHIRHHSAVGLVDRLVKQGLATRRSDAEDRRRVHVYVTPDGEAILARIASANREQLRRLGPEMLAALRSILGS